MAKSLFGTDIADVKGVNYLATSKLKFGDQDGSTIGAQQTSYQVRRDVLQMYEVGSTNMYYVAGRTKGGGKIDNIIGPTKQAISFMAKLAQNICKTGGRPDFQVIPYTECSTMGGSSDGETTGSLSFKDAVLVGVTVAAVADRDLVTGSWDFIFSDVEYSK